MVVRCPYARDSHSPNIRVCCKQLHNKSERVGRRRPTRSFDTSRAARGSPAQFLQSGLALPRLQQPEPLSAGTSTATLRHTFTGTCLVMVWGTHTE